MVRGPSKVGQTPEAVAEARWRPRRDGRKGLPGSAGEGVAKVLRIAATRDGLSRHTGISTETKALHIYDWLGSVAREDAALSMDCAHHQLGAASGVHKDGA